MSVGSNTTANDGISRRRLMGAATAGALGLALVAETANAEGDGPPNGTAVGENGAALAPEDDGSLRAEAVPALNPAYSYRNYGFFEFHANYDIVRGQGVSKTISAPTRFIVAAIDLPVGARIREFTAFVNNSSGVGKSLGIGVENLDGTGSTVAYSTLVPSGTVRSNPITTTVDITIAPDKVFWIFLDTLTADTGVQAVRLGFEGPSAYMPVDPYRAYDSRGPLSPSPGKLAPSTSRVIRVLDAIGPTGAVAVANVIPATARAVSYNLTATGITGPNYLSVTPGSAAGFTVSSINFTSSDIANGGIVRLAAGGAVKVFCGDNVGSTHFIIDITGYYI